MRHESVVGWLVDWKRCVWRSMILLLARKTLETPLGAVDYFDLNVLTEKGISHLDRLPYSIRILLEAVLRNQDGFAVTEAHVDAIANYQATDVGEEKFPLTRVESFFKISPASQPSWTWLHFAVRCIA